MLFGDIHESQVLIAAPFNLPGAEHTMAIGIDQDRYNQSWVVGILAKMVILLFHFRGVDMLEDIFKNEAIMIWWQQVEDVRWEHQVLVKISRVIFEFD
ncbi:hypothetical protein [Endozoicomonas sp. SCSIO W0465]|uniref:hypothetical protein n=1 Tax=Endozoicomonas sp. SCSIO W0465 TaxID=2918516 RepID=UPI00207653E9|nr:hypothetical protein [Endozoicomonas sp. SCSIO W0465]USE38427.1 hypothetical protein MJO57_09800 [Endozoicomonas sp. SCSIO W0465]